VCPVGSFLSLLPTTSTQPPDQGVGVVQVEEEEEEEGVFSV